MGEQELNELKLKIAPVASQYGVESVYLFGSRARGDGDENSDYDFYVKRGKLRGLFAFSGLFSELKNVLKNEVDIVLEPIGRKKLDDYILEAIMKDGVLVYGH